MAVLLPTSRPAGTDVFSQPIGSHDDLQHSVGATYFGWGWASNEVQRRRSETVVGTLASPGACVEGELALQASVLGELQRGCDATARIDAADGGEQSVEVMSDAEWLKLMKCVGGNLSG